MDDLSPWVVTIAAVAVGPGPGLAILSARPLARLLHRAFSPHSKAVPKHSRGSECAEPDGGAASQTVTDRAIVHG